MNPSIELQKQIKDNAADVRKFVSDLSCWEKEMKRKESAARTAALKESVSNICLVFIHFTKLRVINKLSSNFLKIVPHSQSHL